MKIQTRLWSVTVAMAALFAGSIGPNAAWASERDDILAELNQLKNPNADFKVEIWRTQDDKSLTVGEKLQLSFKADRGCYAYIMDIPTGGAAPTVLFPNEWTRSNKVEAGKTYTLPPEGAPYTCKIIGPAGTEQIKVIATSDPILTEFGEQVGKQLAAKGGFAVVTKAGLVKKAISVELKSAGDKVWTENSLSFEVSEP